MQLLLTRFHERERSASMKLSSLQTDLTHSQFLT